MEFRLNLFFFYPYSTVDCRCAAISKLQLIIIPNFPQILKKIKNKIHSIMLGH